MKVLLTSDCVGGVWTYAIDLITELTGLGHEVVVAVMGRDLADDQQRELAATPAAAVHSRPYRLEWMPEPEADLDAAGRWLLDLAAQHQPDVVHLNQLSFGALPWTCPALLVAHSDVVTWWRAVHHCDPPVAWDAYRERVERGLDGADLVVAPTAAMLRELQAAYDLTTPTAVISNGRRLAPSEVPAEPLIAAAGRTWDAAKNIDAAVRAAQGLGWPLQVAGETASSGGAYLDRLSPDGVAQLLARAAIFVAPARYEPFGLAALEAGLSGCALVLGDIPTLREVWGDAALFVPPDDEHILRTTLADLIAKPAALAHWQAVARQRATTYDPSRTAAEYAAGYAQLLARDTASSGVAR